MPSVMSKSQIEREQTIVTIVNEGDQEFVEKHGGIIHRIKARSYMFVPAAKAWLWFGDPIERDTVSDWNQELRRLQARYGFVQDDRTTHKRWKYILDGKIYVKEFGKGSDFYNVDETSVESEFESTALDDFPIEGGNAITATGSLDDIEPKNKKV